MRKYTNTIVSALLVTVLMITLSLGHSFLKAYPLGFTMGEGENIFLPIIESEASAADPAEEILPTAEPEPTATPDPNEDDEAKVIRILATEEKKAGHLALYPGWVASAWDNDDGTWYVEFKSNDGEDFEWLGDGTVDVTTNEIVYSFTPSDLPTDEYQRGLTQIEAYLPHDAEIKNRFNPDLWEKSVGWDRWEQQWYVSYWYGLEEFIIFFNFWDDKPQIDRITDINKLEAKKQAEWVRNQAIELTFEIDGIWEILDGVDDWVSYVEPQGGDLWSVEIVAAGEEKFHALVNTESWTVIESGE